MHHLQFPNYSVYTKQRPFVEVPHVSASSNQNVFEYCCRRHMSNSTVELRTEDNVVRFSFSNNTKSVPMRRTEKKWKRAKSSRKAKVNELRFYRLKAKKKMNSPNPEVRIRYKLEKVFIFDINLYLFSSCMCYLTLYNNRPREKKNG